MLRQGLPTNCFRRTFLYTASAGNTMRSCSAGCLGSGPVRSCHRKCVSPSTADCIVHSFELASQLGCDAETCNFARTCTTCTDPFRWSALSELFSGFISPARKLTRTSSALDIVSFANDASGVRALHCTHASAQCLCWEIRQAHRWTPSVLQDRQTRQRFYICHMCQGIFFDPMISNSGAASNLSSQQQSCQRLDNCFMTRTLA